MQTERNLLERKFYEKKDGLEALLTLGEQEHADARTLILCCYLNYFSYSIKNIKVSMPGYLKRLHALGNALSEADKQHIACLKHIVNKDLYSAFDSMQQAMETLIDDDIAFIIYEALGFKTGRWAELEARYEKIYSKRSDDPTFLGSFSFLQHHLGQYDKANKLIDAALVISPKNAWCQHVYCHTAENRNQEQSINYLLSVCDNWPAHGIFFQSHNWMHLACLLLDKNQHKLAFSAYLEKIKIHQEFLAFQNNSFVFLWQAEMENIAENLATEWADLAKHAELFRQDFFSPCLSISNILTIAKGKSLEEAIQDRNNYQRYTETLPPNSYAYECWNTVGLTLIDACLAYCQGDLENSNKLFSKVFDKNHLVGHSDEQRNIFNTCYNKTRKPN